MMVMKMFIMVMIMVLMMMINLVIFKSFRGRNCEEVDAVPGQGAAQQSLIMIEMIIMIVVMIAMIMIIIIITRSHYILSSEILWPYLRAEF